MAKQKHPVATLDIITGTERNSRNVIQAVRVHPDESKVHVVLEDLPKGFSFESTAIMLNHRDPSAGSLSHMSRGKHQVVINEHAGGGGIAPSAQVHRHGRLVDLVDHGSSLRLDRSKPGKVGGKEIRNLGFVGRSVLLLDAHVACRGELQEHHDETGHHGVDEQAESRSVIAGLRGILGELGSCPLHDLILAGGGGPAYKVPGDPVRSQNAAELWHR